MYKYINEHSIERYDNQILKRWEDGKLVKVVANPGEPELREFGYKHLIETPRPEPKDGYYLTSRYINGDEITIEWTETMITDEDDLFI